VSDGAYVYYAAYLSNGPDGSGFGHAEVFRGSPVSTFAEMTSLSAHIAQSLPAGTSVTVVNLISLKGPPRPPTDTSWLMTESECPPSRWWRWRRNRPKDG
jgi:hypothetical protein